MELTYMKHGDYYLPDPDVPAKEKVPVNRYGRMHGNYLKKNNRTMYNERLLSGRLNRYLAELGEQAEKMLALLTEQYAAAENVTEERKTADQITASSRPMQRPPFFCPEPRLKPKAFSDPSRVSV